MFSGNIHSYGLIYDNKFEISRGIIEFTDILEHKATIAYSEKPSEGQVVFSKEHKLVPIWTTDVYSNNVFQEEDQEYLHFIRNLRQEIDKDLVIQENRFETDASPAPGKKPNQVSAHSEREEASAVHSHSEEADPFAKFMLKNTIIENMVLLSNEVFSRDPQNFSVKYITDLTGCRRVRISKKTQSTSDCFMNLQAPVDNGKMSTQQTQSEKKGSDKFDLSVLDQQQRFALFLNDLANPRVLYRFNLEETSQAQGKHASMFFNAGKADQDQSSKDLQRMQSGSRLGLSSDINPIISPSLYVKQVTSIKHFFKNFFLVLTKKTLLSIYDYESKSVFYLYKIQEDKLHPEINVVGNQMFVLKIKKNSMDKEYFKILIFKFCQESMTVTLVNAKTKLISFIKSTVLHYRDNVYLITVKYNFFGLIVYRFPVPDSTVEYDEEGRLLRSGPEHGANEKLMILHKNTISFQDNFTSISVIEKHLNRIEKSKIQCRKNKFDFIECILQFSILDNILVGLKLVGKDETPDSTGKSEADPEDSKSGKLFTNKQENDKHFKEQYTRERQRSKSQAQKNLLNSDSSNSFVILNSIRLIRNQYFTEVVRSFYNYFYKQYLILVYEVHSFVRIYFYFLGTPKSKNQRMHYDFSPKNNGDNADKPHSEQIDFCRLQNQKIYKDLYYRLELKSKKSKFLGLRFSYDLETTEDPLNSNSFSKTKKIVDIIKVVFNTRIETFVFNSQITIKLKKNTLDFDKIYLYAKNYNNMVKGKHLVRKKMINCKQTLWG